VLDVASDSSADGAQVKMATERIRHDEKVRAIYGFSGGGYNARRIYARLNRGERQRIRKIVVVGSPGITKADFPESADVLIKADPPAGHMAGPKALLDTLSD
jgi:pimeloyl-ACP methyl ester carboxylesterase